MLEALARLQRLWYLILFCATFCLIADITLSSISDRYLKSFTYIPLPLIADIPTVLIFAYGLWGKSQPFLLPSSSPTSSSCMRWTRLIGTVFLCLLWIMNTFIYISSELVVRKIFAGIAALNSILILVEMMGSHRIGKEQRRILKKERKEQQEKLELRQLKLQRKKEEEHHPSQGDSGFENILAAASRERLNDLERGNRGSMDSDDDDDDNGQNALNGVEIVRPEAIDPSTVIYSQHVLYEMHQRQYFMQYQQFLQSQHHLSSGGASSTAGQSSSPVDQDPDDTEIEGKYDDILQQSSFKFEIPIDGPLEGSSSPMPMAPAVSSVSERKTEASLTSLSPSTPPLTDVKNPFMYPPSAPSISGLTETSTAQPHNHSNYSAMSVSTASSLSTSSPASPSLAPSTAASPPIPYRPDEKSSGTSSGRQALADSSPYSEQDYQSKSQEFASAPPYESRLSFQVQQGLPTPVPSLAPMPIAKAQATTTSVDNHIQSVAMTLISTAAGSAPVETEVIDAVATKDQKMHDQI
ncbi:hypothetical protein BGZ83_004761 [Gryganskiella cystojenkinii]|nr:hypothetical protein BGZ83_004761 [Gryganskiella cystojenkinii]